MLSPAKIIQVVLNQTKMRANVNKFFFLVALGWAVFVPKQATAQTVECTENLNKAQAAFDIGNLTGIPKSLEECIRDKSFSPEESVRAHKLITLVYLYQDDQANADMWMGRLLLVDPEHRLDPATDPAEIVYLKEKFLYKPIFRVSLSFLANRTSYREITEYTTSSVSASRFAASGQELVNESTPGIGINAHLTVEKEFFPGFDLGLAVGYVSKSFLLSKDINYPGNNLLLNESLTLLDVPLFAKYTYYGDGYANWNPYLMGGAGLGYLIDASQSEVERSNPQASIPGGTIDLLEFEQRRTLNYYAFGGLGVKKRMKTHFLFFEAKYLRGLTLVNNGDTRFMGSPVSNYSLGKIDSNFTLDGIMVSVGYQRSIYNPKKIKN